MDICKNCGGQMKYYDTVKRIVRGKRGTVMVTYVERMRCTCCTGIRRVLPESVLPYKQYDAEIIRGVVEGIITPETLGYEDYPCEMTMKRWKQEKLLS